MDYAPTVLLVAVSSDYHFAVPWIDVQLYLLYPKNPTWRLLRAIPTPGSEKYP